MLLSLHFRNEKLIFILIGNICLCFLSSDIETFFTWIILWRKQPLAASTCPFNTRERSSKFKGMYSNNVLAFWTILSRGYKGLPLEITLLFDNSNATKNLIPNNVSHKFARLFNPFQPSHLISTGFYMKHNTGLKWFKETFTKFLRNCKELPKKYDQAFSKRRNLYISGDK